jgi:2,3-bisphosphoglycerate-independent phosphoglycerate mutase
MYFIRNFDAPTYATAKEGVEASYNEGLTDEFVVPFIVAFECSVRKNFR